MTTANATTIANLTHDLGAVRAAAFEALNLSHLSGYAHIDGKIVFGGPLVKGADVVGDIVETEVNGGTTEHLVELDGARYIVVIFADGGFCHY